jgi:hypothetical protein
MESNTFVFSNSLRDVPSIGRCLSDKQLIARRARHKLAPLPRLHHFYMRQDYFTLLMICCHSTLFNSYNVAVTQWPFRVPQSAQHSLKPGAIISRCLPSTKQRRRAAAGYRGECFMPVQPFFSAKFWTPMLRVPRASYVSPPDDSCGANVSSAQAAYTYPCPPPPPQP